MFYQSFELLTADLGQNLFESVHDSHLFIESACLIRFILDSHLHTILHEWYEALAADPVDWNAILELFCDLPFGWLPNINSVVHHWSFVVEPQYTIVWLRV